MSVGGKQTNAGPPGVLPADAPVDYIYEGPPLCVARICAVPGQPLIFE
jgi:hypothetical protein